MFKLVLIASLVATTVAFAPTGRVALARPSSSIKMAFDNEIGALPPVGFWDPLGLSADGDVEKFDQYRTAELKHGRVSMLAVIGYLVQSVARLPGTIDLDGTTFDSIPNGVQALGVVPTLGWLQMILVVGWYELAYWKDREEETGSGNIGDFGWYPGSGPKPDQLDELRTKEIQNGRLAMIAIAELITHDVWRPAGEDIFTLHHF